MVNVAGESVRVKQRSALPLTKRARLEEAFQRAGTILKKIFGGTGNLRPGVGTAQNSAVSDFDFAIELLAQCVMGNPANPTYVRAYLEALQKGQQGGRNRLAGGDERTARNGLKKTLNTGQWDEAVRHGLVALKANPWDLPTLTQMATAAKESGDSDSELCYLKAALTKSPKDPTCNRMAAIVLDEMGLVNQAIIFWQRVAESLPKDKQALEAITAFQVGAKSQGTAQRRGPTAQEQEELVRQRQEELARQRKLQAEEEAAREQERERQAALEPEEDVVAVATSEAAVASEPSEKTRMVGVNEAAEGAYKEGYEYDLEEPKPAFEWTKDKVLVLVVMLGTWLVVMAFAAMKWGPQLWKRYGWPWWAWIVLGVVFLVMAAGVRTVQRR